MFQTWWDLNQQTLRKTIDYGLGILAGYGAFAGEWTPVVLALLGFAVNFAWFYMSNRKKVSVKGLEQAGATNAAAAVEAVVDVAGRKARQ